jgi:hypothetical protein
LVSKRLVRRDKAGKKQRGKRWVIELEIVDDDDEGLQSYCAFVDEDWKEGNISMSMRSSRFRRKDRCSESRSRQ